MNDDDIHEIPRATPDLQTELARRLQELVPEAIADSKVDVTKLTELLGDDAGSKAERFGLFWPGKRRALRAAQEPTTATLKPVKDQSKDWDTTKNVFIEGDNLEVLKILQKHYHGKIKMIYIDPPYNTGKDFIYPDNYKEGLQTYLEFTQQVDAGGNKLSTNSESEGRYHSNWLNMMYPRLKLARNLLTQDGVIFISIDDTELGNLRRLCDELFGEACFVGMFKWNKTSKAPTLSRLIRNKYEYVLTYSRGHTQRLRGTDSYNTAAPLLNSGNPRSTLLFRAGSLQCRFEDGTYAAGLYGEGDKGVELLDELVVRDRVNLNDARIEARFKWAQSTLDQRMDEGQEIFFKTAKLTTLYYSLNPTDGKFIAPADVISDAEVGVKRYDEAYVALRELFSGRTVFDYSKPVSLLKYLVRMVPEDDFVALDLFSGSATTAHAIMELNHEDGGNRRHIQVQLPEPTPGDSAARAEGFAHVAALARRRIELAGERISGTAPGEQHVLGQSAVDVGFRAYRLIDTNFSKWRVASDVEPDALEQRLLDLRESAEDTASPDDLLTELLLKQGHSLIEDVRDIDVAGLDMRSVGENLVLAYLNEHVKPTLDQLRAVADLGPVKIIILEDAFQGDDELKTNLAQICTANDIELWTA